MTPLVALHLKAEENFTDQFGMKRCVCVCVCVCGTCV